MKRLIIFIIFLFIALIIIPAVVSAQTSEAGFRGQSMNGSTGLFYIPSGRIGWDDSNFGLDFGYRAVINDVKAAHVPAITASFMKLIEVSAAFDIQPDLNNEKNNDDVLLGLKLRVPTNVPIAVGGNFQFLNIGSSQKPEDSEMVRGTNHSYSTVQPYIAITYPGTLFSMKAETTLMVGKTFYLDSDNNSDVDFGMGFDLVLFPDVFGEAVHWIIDFANFGYSDNAWPYYSAEFRGILNTGFRIDLSAIPAFRNFKILLDFVFNDLFDDGNKHKGMQTSGRSFTAGAVFGFKL